MRIGFDLRPALRKNHRHRGIGKYTHQLLKSLLERGPQHQYVVYILGGHDISLPGNFEVRALPYLRRPNRLNWLLDWILLPLQLRRDQIQLFHATDITSIPRTTSCRVWAHVHDMIPYLFWRQTVQHASADYLLALRKFRRDMKRADLIITVSRHSKRDICKALGKQSAEVQVIAPGCEEHFRPHPQHKARTLVQRHYGLQHPFLFYVGGTDFRKNLKRLIGAFRLLRQHGYPGKLVLAGETFSSDIPEVIEIHNHIEECDLREHVATIGYVPDEHLPHLYSSCDFFVFPSLYEGFGLPVLEAMACGAPVVTSQVSSIPEVAGEAALYFDPAQVESIAASMIAAWESPNRLSDLRQKGFQQVQLFSWVSAAEKLLQTYHRHGFN